MNAMLNAKRLKKQFLNPFSSYLSVFFCTCFLSLCSLYTSAYTAHALGEVTAFIKAELTRSDFGNYPTFFDFRPDLRLCTEEYGEEYVKEFCNPAFGEIGTTAKGIITRNMPEGEWVWDSPTRLKFIPKNPWQDTATLKNSGAWNYLGSWQSSVDMHKKYEVDLASFEVPYYIRFSNDLFSAKYITISADIENGNFFFDSSDNANHALSFAIAFSESIDENTRKDIEKRTVLQKIKGDNVRIGKQHWTWFKDNTKAVVYAPILHLPKNQALVLITIYDVGILHQDGKIAGDTIWNEVFITPHPQEVD